MTQYLRQKGTGHIYIATETLLKRDDMIPYDVTTALKRIKAIKEELKKRQQVIEGLGGEDVAGVDDMKSKVAKTLTELEKSLDEFKKKQMEVIKKEENMVSPEDTGEMTEEELKAKVREEKISNDPEVKKIMGFRNKNALEEYSLKEYGFEIDRRESLQKSKEKVKALRIKRMEEAGLLDG